VKKEMEDEGYREVWVTYGTKYYSAKELTVQPGRSVTIKDAWAYGVIVTQGHGRLGKLNGLYSFDDPASAR